MISLTIYAKNNLGSSLNYIPKKLWFEGFFLGERRDPENLRMIRRFSEGSIIINGDDFTALEPYIYLKQSSKLTINGNDYWGVCHFFDINTKTKTLRISYEITDAYSIAIEGLKNTGIDLELIEPLFDVPIKISDLNIIPNYFYVDGSQYRYNSPYEDFWGVEEMTVSGNFEAYKQAIEHFNAGGVTPEEILPIPDYAFENFYKPISVLYTNPVNTKYRNIDMTYSREYRYFPEEEEPDDTWQRTSAHKTKNGVFYTKYVRFLEGKEQTYFSQKEIYFIKDRHLSDAYMSVSFQGSYNNYQASANFVLLNDIILRLSEKIFEKKLTLDSDIPDIYIASLKSYNLDETFEEELFELNSIINFLKSRLGIYFAVEGVNLTCKRLSVNNLILDLKNYNGRAWLENEEITILNLPVKYKFESISEKIDFKGRTITFVGLDKTSKNIPSKVFSDCEIEDTDGYIVIDAEEVQKEQLRELHPAANYNNEFLARSFNIGVNGTWFKYVFNNYSVILESNYIYLSGSFHLAFTFHHSNGYAKVEIGNISVVLSASGNYSYNGTGTGKTRLKITLYNTSYVIGEFSNLTVSTGTLIPKTKTGIYSGLKVKNGSLALPNAIIENKPLMSFPKGILENKGEIDCNVNFGKEINFEIRLGSSIFGYNFDGYYKLHADKYIPFEIKKQIFSEEDISQYSLIKARSNEVY